jgi:hypothetical protein
MCDIKNQKIPNKFINEEFLGFLAYLLPLDESARLKQRPITGEGSLQELANDYQLLILHSIDLGDILKLFKETVCAEIHEKENYIQYSTQNVGCLINEIRARIK